jgi:hypothetical protein
MLVYIMLHEMGDIGHLEDNAHTANEARKQPASGSGISRERGQQYSTCMLRTEGNAQHAVRQILGDWSSFTCCMTYQDLGSCTTACLSVACSRDGTSRTNSRCCEKYSVEWKSCNLRRFWSKRLTRQRCQDTELTQTSSSGHH